MKKLLCLISIVSLLTGCGGGGSGSSSTDSVTAPGAVAPADPTNGGGSGSGPTSESVTYYHRSVTLAPIGGWPAKTYTAVGSCMLYATKIYCWDDGTKSVVIPAVATYHYSYFNMDTNGASWGPCSGGCQTDLMAQPTFVSATLAVNLTDPVVNQVFAGTATTVSCTKTNGILNCGSFQVDTTQSPL